MNGICWACRPLMIVSADYVFVDALGDDWPLCRSHYLMWLVSKIYMHNEVPGEREKILSAMVTVEAAEGIEQIEDMLRGHVK